MSDVLHGASIRLPSDWWLQCPMARNSVGTRKWSERDSDPVMQVMSVLFPFLSTEQGQSEDEHQYGQYGEGD